MADSNGKLISLEMLLWQMLHFCIFTSRRAMINLTEGTPCGANTYAAKAKSLKTPHKSPNSDSR